MKLAVIGGGSTYTPELIDGVLVRRERLPITEIVLVDIDGTRRDVIGDFARRMVNRVGGKIKITQSSYLPEAVAGADFIVNQIRVGGQNARHRDEMLGREFGIIGQETVGVGGFAKALRTIPVVNEIAQTVVEYAPHAFFINFTNPAGLITQFLTSHFSLLNVIGLCNVPWNLKVEISHLTNVSMKDLELDYVGLNHLSWVRGVSVNHLDLSAMALEGFEGLTVNKASSDSEPEWQQSIVHAMRAIPNYYLMYYYQTQEWIEYQKIHPTRASRVAEIEKELMKRYTDPMLDHKPEELMQRGGAYYSDSAAELMADIANDAGTIHIVNTANHDAVPEFGSHDVLEIPARISRQGVTPIPTRNLEPEMFSLVAKVKGFELRTILAALTGDEDLAKEALLSNPLGPSEAIVDQVWNRLKQVNQGVLGAFADA